jgi:hypothetical protein
MGFFGEFTYSGGQWHEVDTAVEPFVTIKIHDSDIAIVDYRPAFGAEGQFFLGTEPRIYFEDDRIAPVDRTAESSAFARWLQVATGREIEPNAIAVFLPLDEDEEPQDVFVEETVERFLQAVGLPVPPGLTDVG